MLSPNCLDSSVLNINYSAAYITVYVLYSIPSVGYHVYIPERAYGPLHLLLVRIDPLQYAGGWLQASAMQ